MSIRRARGWGNIYLPRPRVAYTLQDQDYRYASDFPYWKGILDIDFSDFVLFGDPGGSLIQLRTFGGGNPDTDYGLVPRYATDPDSPFGPSPPPANWASSHAYTLGDEVLGPNGHHYACTVTGTSGLSGPSDLSPATAGDIADGGARWALFDLTFRGNMFRIKSFAINSDAPITGIKFRDIIFDGGAPRQEALWPLAVHAIPDRAASVDRPPTYGGGPPIPAGAGWAHGHQAVRMVPPYTYGDVTFENCEWRNWREDNVYQSQGSGLAGTVRFKGKCKIVSAGSNGVSMTGPLQCDDLEIVDTAQAVENDASSYNQTYRRIYIHDCGMGLTMPSNAGGYSGRRQVLVENSRIENCTEAGVFISGFSSNVTVRSTDVIDCGQIPGFAAFEVVDQFGGTPQNVQTDGVRIVVDRKAVQVALACSQNTSPSPVNVHRNLSLLRTQAAADAGLIMQSGALVSVGNGTEVAIIDGDHRGGNLQPIATVTGTGKVRFIGNRLDAPTPLYTVTAPFLDPFWHERYVVQPAGPVTLTTPQNFQVGVEAEMVINNQVTIANGANIVLAGGVNLIPADGIDTIWFKRPSSASNRVVETRRSRV